MNMKAKISYTRPSGHFELKEKYIKAVSLDFQKPNTYKKNVGWGALTVYENPPGVPNRKYPPAPRSQNSKDFY